MVEFSLKIVATTVSRCNSMPSATVIKVKAALTFNLILSTLYGGATCLICSSMFMPALGAMTHIQRIRPILFPDYLYLELQR